MTVNRRVCAIARFARSGFLTIVVLGVPLRSTPGFMLPPAARVWKLQPALTCSDLPEVCATTSAARILSSPGSAPVDLRQHPSRRQKSFDTRCGFSMIVLKISGLHFLTVTRLVLEVCPALISTALRETPSAFARTAMSSRLAAPSTGAAASRTRKPPLCSPAISLRDARGTT